jgi:Putative adhesin
MRISMMGLAMFIVALPAVAQPGQERALSCNDRNNNNSRNVSHCEMREQNLGFAGRLTVDGGTNGGVSIKGWDQGGVLVRARVEAQGEDEATAASMVAQVRVDVSAGQVSASGPDQSRGRGWSVSYEVFVPRQGDLNIKANNGGISISDVRGNIEFQTVNGGVSLRRLAGQVEGTTQNGGLTVELAGARWDGNKFDVRTSNGGVNVSMPENYSAHLETATVNGNLNVAFPMTVHGEIGRRLSTDIGSGGPTIHVETTNGGVNIKRAAM